MKNFRNRLLNWDLQSRLLFIFTLVFLIAVLILSGFLQMTTNLIAYNSDSRDMFGQTQKTYRLQDALQKMKLAQNNYEINSDVNAQIDFNSYSARMDEYIQDLLDDEERIQDERSPDAIQSLENLQQFKGQYVALFGQIVDAVDAESYDAVQPLDDQASQVASQMDAEVQSLSQLWAETLTGVEGNVNAFSTLAWALVLCALPVFLTFIAVAGMMIHNQATRPLNVLTRAAAALEAGQLDPAMLQPLAARKDEVGIMATEFIQMAKATSDRRAALQQQADEIRAKIR